jgi:hypothetical protein
MCTSSNPTQFFACFRISQTDCVWTTFWRRQSNLISPSRYSVCANGRFARPIKTRMRCLLFTPRAEIVRSPLEPRQLVQQTDLLATSVTQPIQKLFRRDQIDAAETFCEPIVDRLHAGDGLGTTALSAPQVGEARCGAQRQRQPTLLVGKIQRPPEEILRWFRSGRRGL